MQNLLFKGYLILAYLSLRWTLGCEFKFLVSLNVLFWFETVIPGKKKNITILVRHLEREAKITGKKFAGDRRSPNCVLSLLGKEM